MKNANDMNGFIQWNESELEFRDYLTRAIPQTVKEVLTGENRGWLFKRVETPTLIPSKMVSPNYTAEDIWNAERLSETSTAMTLRPETTPGTYSALAYMLSHQEAIPPVCVWQIGKSFRREADQPTKFMRLKEFNQMEFQCLYAEGTMNDYQAAVLEPLKAMVKGLLKLPVRTVDSDRLPSYSKRTVDIEVYDDSSDDAEGRWMEVCSISLRTDFPDKLQFTTSKGTVIKTAFVLEIAFGIDRLVYLNTTKK